MTDGVPAPGVDETGWVDAARAAQILAVSPQELGGVCLTARAGPVRDRWLEELNGCLDDVPVRRLPPGVPDARLLGGLDLAATLASGQPVQDRGLLAEADGGVLIVPMAERLPPETAARICGAIDTRAASGFGTVLLDEGIDADERPPASIADRLAIWINLNPIGARDLPDLTAPAAAIADARRRLPNVSVPDTMLDSVCAAALALGVRSLRASIFALKVARVAAALDGRREAAKEDAALAARLVLLPRATVNPLDAMEEEPEPAPADPPDGPDAEEPDGKTELDPDQLEDTIRAAAEAILPAGLLDQVSVGTSRSPRSAAGRSPSTRRALTRGRPVGTRSGDPRTGARLNVIETLRAAAPWQGLRRRQASAASGADSKRIEVRRDDFRVYRYRQPTRTTTILAVDASGSTALHRLSEAKGAVELLLGESYVRRDEVSLISFRGAAAEVLLPPTRSLARAKRSLSALAGGGGTPLASAIMLSADVADGAARAGDQPMIVLLTDGRPNIALDGSPGREQAEADALAAARRVRVQAFAGLVIDISPHRKPFLEQLAREMGAQYLPLPHAGAAEISQAAAGVAGQAAAAV